MAAQARPLVQSMTALREAGDEEDIKMDREKVPTYNAGCGCVAEWAKSGGHKP